MMCIVEESYIRRFINSLLNRECDILINAILLINKTKVSYKDCCELYQFGIDLMLSDYSDLVILEPKNYEWDNFIWSYGEERANLIRHLLHFQQTLDWYSEWERLFDEFLNVEGE